MSCITSANICIILLIIEIMPTKEADSQIHLNLVLAVQIDTTGVATGHGAVLHQTSRVIAARVRAPDAAAARQVRLSIVEGQVAR